MRPSCVDEGIGRTSGVFRGSEKYPSVQLEPREGLKPRPGIRIQATWGALRADVSGTCGSTAVSAQWVASFRRVGVPWAGARKEVWR